jgi:hypothetical protein
MIDVRISARKLTNVIIRKTIEPIASAAR